MDAALVAGIVLVVGIAVLLLARVPIAVAVGFSAFVAVQGAKRFRRNGPVVEVNPAFAERMLEALVRPGDKAVERGRDVATELGHAAIVVV